VDVNSEGEKERVYEGERGREREGESTCVPELKIPT
jgi:hypothetical protein